MAKGTRLTGNLSAELTSFVGRRAELAIDGIETGDAEIIADETSRHVLGGLSAGVAGLYPQVA